MSGVFLGLNSLSLDARLTPAEFESALKTILEFRQAARPTGNSLACCRSILDREGPGAVSFRALLKGLHVSSNIRQLALSWLSKEGPYWDELRVHTGDDWYELQQGTVVTDTIVGEAAHRVNIGVGNNALASLPTNGFETEELQICAVRSDTSRSEITVTNHTTSEAIQTWLQAREAPLASWRQLEERARQRLESLSLPKAAFEELSSHPFHQGAAERLFECLAILAQIQSGTSASGMTARARELYDRYFTGHNARFTDSSETEKHDFKDELTFIDPEQGGAKVFCPWHGKVKTPQLRVHHSWPPSSGSRVFVPYVGPKITKR